MKAFTAQIYEKGVQIFPGIYLTVYNWEKPDPFISLGWSDRVYPPPLFSCIEDKKLIEIENSAINLLSLPTGTKANNFSLFGPEERLLVAWHIGKISSLIDRPHKNYILGIGHSPTFSNGNIVTNLCYSHLDILAVLPANGGSIEAIGRFYDAELKDHHHKATLKTLHGEVTIKLSN